MQVSNTLNNSIRILFNPKVEAFKLFDFLIVKSGSDRYIAEIIEIYDDKFDSSQDVAKLRIFYKLSENDEVMPYDNFTPNKECEILKIKQEEIEKFINQDKETFIIGTNVKSQSALNVQYDFFNKNAIILADKIENSNAISQNLAKNLSEKKHTVIVDSTGIIEFEKVKKITASKNFKMPLNFTTIDFIFDKCLSDASLEFQATGGQIINEIKKFAKKQEHGFISFNAFTRVLLEQYKVTPYAELKLLLSRIKRYQMSEVFATNKKDYENLFKTIKDNPITIVDLSGVEASWQKAYLEYIVEDLQDEVYLITRLNDENCDVDLLNKIYCRKKNITFVPTVSYNYKKLPSIMQYCKNYILLPSLYQRNDFLNANFALCNLIADGCIIFGENTDNFLYLAKDYELKVQEEKRNNYRKIALSLIEDEQETLAQQLGQKGDYFENKAKENAKKTDSEKLMEELTRFEEEQNEPKPEESEVNPQTVESSDEEESSDFFESVMNQNSDDSKEVDTEDVVSEKETSETEKANETEPAGESEEQKPVEETEPEAQEEIFKESDSKEIEEKEETLEISDNDEFGQIESEIELTDEAPKEFADEITIDKESVELEEMEETNELDIKSSADEFEEIAHKEPQKEPVKKTDEETKEFEPKSDPQIGKVDITSAELIDTEEINLEELAKGGMTDYEKAQKEKGEEKPFVEDGHDVIDLNKTTDEADALGDDELDFIELAKASKENENLELNELAEASMEENFEQIVDSKPEKDTTQTIAIDKDINISSDILEQPAKNSSLPIFKEEEKKDEMPEFKEGDIIIHPKYGRGKIIKTLKHEQRQLVHVDFEETEKKLLDPKVANIKLEQ